jgi:hypothetical protein
MAGIDWVHVLCIAATLFDLAGHCVSALALSTSHHHVINGNVSVVAVPVLVLC